MTSWFLSTPSLFIEHIINNKIIIMGLGYAGNIFKLF